MTREQSRKRLHGALVELYNLKQLRGQITASDVRKCLLERHLSAMAFTLVFSYVNKDSVPTYEDACKLREESNKRIHEGVQRKITGLSRPMELLPQDDIEAAIRLLKKNGYVVMTIH